jgi:hypothetical protein
MTPAALNAIRLLAGVNKGERERDAISRVLRRLVRELCKLAHQPERDGPIVPVGVAPYLRSWPSAPSVASKPRRFPRLGYLLGICCARLR